MKIQQQLPKEQVNILLHGLKMLKTAYQITAEKDNHLDFDILTLESLLKYDVKIELSEKELKDFIKNEGIDFPKYSI